MSAAAKPLSIGQCATLACLLEVAAPKVGNVHRGADFEDLSLENFLVAAVAIAPAMEAASRQPLGDTVLQAVQASRSVLSTNVNLGMVLLIAPLAAVDRRRALNEGIRQVLGQLTDDDARKVYAAIRLAEPGGMGKVDQYDLASPPPADLMTAMRSASERDLVARQYAHDFSDVLERALPWLAQGIERGWTISQATVRAHLQVMAQCPDTLIARKCGLETAQRAAAMAADALAAGLPGDEDYEAALAQLDFWLRADGHRRNPGASADLIAAALFAGLRDGRLISGPYPTS
jgi:triphosphoribosyl-dephospho-CoA synthase